MSSFSQTDNTNGMEVAPTSSVPIGSFAEKTKGRQPRSRESSTQEAMSRVNQEDLNHFEKIFEIEQHGRTYMSKDATPPGFAGMWVRTAIYGNTDHSNVAHMMRKGWIAPSSEKYPREAFLNTYGDITDEKGILERPGLIWMLRPIEIDNLEKQVHERRLNNSRHFIEASRLVGSIDGGFVTGRGTNGQTVTFSENPQAQYVASMFGH
jgi:hypothetical protein